MKSIQFLKKQLSILVRNIPYIKCCYFFRRFDNTHIIKVKPKYFFKNDKEYIKLESKIMMAFLKKFPYEDIVFIAPDDILLNTDEFIDEFVGDFYKLLNLRMPVVNPPLTIQTKITIAKNTSFQVVANYTPKYFWNKECNIINYQIEKKWYYNQLYFGQEEISAEEYAYALAA